MIYIYMAKSKKTTLFLLGIILVVITISLLFSSSVVEGVDKSQPVKPAPKPAPQPVKPAPQPVKPAPQPAPQPVKPAPQPAPQPVKPAPQTVIPVPQPVQAPSIQASSIQSSPVQVLQPQGLTSVQLQQLEQLQIQEKNQLNDSLQKLQLILTNDQKAQLQNIPQDIIQKLTKILEPQINIIKNLQLTPDQIQLLQTQIKVSLQPLEVPLKEIQKIIQSQLQDLLIFLQKPIPTLKQQLQLTDTQTDLLTKLQPVINTEQQIQNILSK